MPDITVTLYSSSFCGACTSTRVTLDRVASVLDDRVAFREVNIANSPDEGEQLRIEATPTVVMTKADGTEVMRATGVPTTDQVLGAIARHLG